ncbi:hypothetical protein LTR09_010855 [Extremus antarcticus]|uniref:Uncharacterized protein n=1 Tax=Extremus antarcticus TaxID=702011 RepID=A0AAJ0D755_9PEZI|nr:hypothetical protein LTR09_010855 [Extremus antarcticus]
MAPPKRERGRKAALQPQDITDKIGNWLDSGPSTLLSGPSSDRGGRQSSQSRPEHPRSGSHVPLIQPSLTNQSGLTIGPDGAVAFKGREWKSILPLEKLEILRKEAAVKPSQTSSVTNFDYWNLSLLDALKHWLQHKGLWIINGEFRAYDFVRWYNGFQVFIECKAVEEYVQHLVHIHLQLHAIIFLISEDVDTLTQACNDLVLPERARVQRQNDDNNDITRIKGGLLENLELHDVSEDEAWGHAGAVIPLTRTSWVDGRNVPGLPNYYEFLDDFELRPLRAVGFGGMSHNHVPRLAYCVRSHHYQEIVELINRALANDTRPLEEALVLETLFIY